MKKQQWDEVFDALFDGVRHLGDGLVAQARKQRYKLDDMVDRARKTDIDAGAKVYKYDMVNDPGPLPESAAENFAGGRYDVEVLEEDLVLFRAGDSEHEWGSYWSDAPPVGELQARIDFAIERSWLDDEGLPTIHSDINTGRAVLIPRGTTIYRGPVASRGNTLVGGAAEQIFLPRNIAADVGTQLASWRLP